MAPSGSSARFAAAKPSSISRSALAMSPSTVANIARNHTPADYKAIVQLGRGLGMRPQAAMILCEWDTTNMLRRLPTATWMGKDWDNSRWVGPWLDEAAHIIRGNSLHLEVTLHGVGHEYWIWPEGTLSRAEWMDRAGIMRPRDHVEAHLEFFGRLLDQHQLGTFPESFVPTAHYHRFGPQKDEEDAFASVLRQHGVRSISTNFRRMHNAESVQHGLFGMDAGVMTVSRGSRDPLDWCGMHWPNILHPDPNRNHEIVEGWIRFLKPYDRRLTTLLAPDTTAFCSQLAYHCCTRLTPGEGFVELECDKLDTLPGPPVGDEFTVKLAGRPGLSLSASGAALISTAADPRNGQSIYTLRLRRRGGNKRCRIRFLSEHRP